MWGCAWRRQLVQKAAARMLLGVNKYDHVIPILHDLHWLLIPFQTQFKLLGLTYKSPRWDQGPGYLADHLCRYVPTCVICSDGAALLVVTPAK